MKVSEKWGIILMITCMVMVMFPSMAFAQSGETGTSWAISKSKTATNLDEKFESEVTLSLPAAETELATDVVLVLDKSTSAQIEEQALAMLDELSQKNAAIKVGVIIFNKEAHRVLELTELNANSMPKVNDAIKTEIKSGTNLHAGILAGKAMLDEDKEVGANRKYMLVISDGITYMFNENPTAVAWSFSGDSVLNFAGPDNWASKYGSNDAPNDWDVWFGEIQKQIEADGTKYEYPYGGTVVNATPVEEQSEHAMSVDKALYLCGKAYGDAETAGYNCYAMKATAQSGQANLWGPAFMDYLAKGETASFENIQKDIYYLIDKGSKVVDEMGKTAEYDFDFIDDTERIQLTVGNEKPVISKLKSAAGVTSTYGFGEPSAEGEYRFVLEYYKDGKADFGECFVWYINEAVCIDKKVQLTYAVKLSDPQVKAGTYGEYDADGSKGLPGLYTNNQAVLIAVPSGGTIADAVAEEFAKPTVSYIAAPENDTEKDDEVPKTGDAGAAVGCVTVMAISSLCFAILRRKQIKQK